MGCELQTNVPCEGKVRESRTDDARRAKAVWHDRHPQPALDKPECVVVIIDPGREEWTHASGRKIAASKGKKLAVAPDEHGFSRQLGTVDQIPFGQKMIRRHCKRIALAEEAILRKATFVPQDGERDIDAASGKVIAQLTLSSLNEFNSL